MHKGLELQPIASIFEFASLAPYNDGGGDRDENKPVNSVLRVSCHGVNQFESRRGKGGTVPAGNVFTPVREEPNNVSIVKIIAQEPEEAGLQPDREGELVYNSDNAALYISTDNRWLKLGVGDFQPEHWNTSLRDGDVRCAEHHERQTLLLTGTHSRPGAPNGTPEDDGRLLVQLGGIYRISVVGRVDSDTDRLKEVILRLTIERAGENINIQLIHEQPSPDVPQVTLTMGDLNLIELRAGDHLTLEGWAYASGDKPWVGIWRADTFRFSGQRVEVRA